MSTAVRDSVDWEGLHANLSDVIYVIRLAPDLGFEYVSGSVTAVVGYTPEEHYADPDLGARLVHPADLPTLAAAATAPVGEPVEMMLRWVARDGHQVWTQHRARKRLREDGSVVLEGVARDVTALHEARVRLEQASADYRLLAENASDVVYRSTVDGICQWISPSVRSVLGWPPEDLVGRHLADLVHPADAAVVTEQRWHAVIDGDHESFEARYRCADGTYRWMSVRGRPFRTDGPSPAGAVVNMRDVHDEVLARQALQSSEAHFRLLAENSSDVVIRGSLAGLVEWVSPSVVDFLGWRPADLVGRTPAVLTHPDDLPRVAAAVRRAGSGEQVRMELRACTASGGFRWVSAATRPARDDTGRLVGTVITLHDLGEVVALRAELARCREQLERAEGSGA